ncbi:MAG TPA: L,D-transpeptidase [Pyrinomonadaceae bacterium]|jgi:lipoprotein-anchoring transpeptidase ErfK/SrfK
MKVFARGGAALIAALALAAGCQIAPPNTTNTSAPGNTNAPSNTASPPATAAASPSAPADGAGATPVTLPVLDAFFAEESFGGELKDRLQLTDEQVARLRTLAREETASLHESDDDARGGAAAAASARAAEQIKSVVGPEKAEQLFAFVRERWAGKPGAAGDAAAALPDRPNTVPVDTRVVVNAPAYRMDVFRDGQLLKTYKIGIGYPEFPLPAGRRSARNIIFNPTWTPPDEPWVEAGKSKVKVGEKVPAGSKLNPLGPIKIPIGLPSLIHGGKAPARLGGFASHGCVGLTDAQVQDFAVVLAGLAGAQLTAEDVAGYQKQKTETKSVDLGRAVPVELRYETIVVEDGRLHVYRDVYDRGTNTEENLRRVLEVYGVSLDNLTPQERAQVTDALDQMARDAQGQPAAGDGTTNDNAHKNENRNGNKNGNKDGNDNKRAQQEAARVTRTIKGRKEIVIDVAALRGKGYPAPVNFDTGGGAKQGKKPQAAKRG